MATRRRRPQVDESCQEQEDDDCPHGDTIPSDPPAYLKWIEVFLAHRHRKHFLINEIGDANDRVEEKRREDIAGNEQVPKPNQRAGTAKQRQQSAEYRTRRANSATIDDRKNDRSRVICGQFVDPLFSIRRQWTESHPCRQADDKRGQRRQPQWDRQGIQRLALGSPRSDPGFDPGEAGCEGGIAEAFEEVRATVGETTAYR